MEEIEGIITCFFPERGFGFLWNEQSESECFFPIKDCFKEKVPETGDLVSCRAEKTSEGYQARDVRLLQAGHTRIAPLVGVTSWVGSGSHGDYGLANHRGEKGDGTFLHNSKLIGGSSTLEHSTLYRMDVARIKGRYEGLNVRRVTRMDTDVIQRVADDSEEDPRVRLKALEMLWAMTGRSEEFKRKVRQAAPGSPQSGLLEIGMKIWDYFEFTLRGTPDDNTVKIVQTVVVGGITIVGTIVAGTVLKTVLKA